MEYPHTHKFMKHFSSLGSKTKSTSGTKSKKAPYIKVDNARRDLLLQLLVDNPTMQVKHAAIRSQIKYPRATALARQYREYIMY